MNFSSYFLHFLFNPFLANVPILYPLKTLKNLWFFGIFSGYKMGTLARNGLNKSFSLALLSTSRICRFGSKIIISLCIPFQSTQNLSSMINYFYLLKFQISSKKAQWLKVNDFLFPSGRGDRFFKYLGNEKTLLIFLPLTTHCWKEVLHQYCNGKLILNTWHNNIKINCDWRK